MEDTLWRDTFYHHITVQVTLWGWWCKVKEVQQNLHSTTEFIQCLSWWDDRKWENNVHKLQKDNHSLNLDSAFRRENIHLVCYYLGVLFLCLCFPKVCQFLKCENMNGHPHSTFFALSRCNNQKYDSVMVFPVLVCWLQKFRWMRWFIFIQLLKFVSGHIVMQKDSNSCSQGCWPTDKHRPQWD